jgi:hypothetical protein
MVPVYFYEMPIAAMTPERRPGSWIAVFHRCLVWLSLEHCHSEGGPEILDGSDGFLLEKLTRDGVEMLRVSVPLERAQREWRDHVPGHIKSPTGLFGKEPAVRKERERPNGRKGKAEKSQATPPRGASESVADDDPGATEIAACLCGDVHAAG